MPAGQQRVDVGGVAVQPFGLPVRSERSPDVGALIPVQAQPVQGIEDLLLAVLTEPRLIGVLDPQDELPPLLPGEGEVEEET